MKSQVKRRHLTSQCFQQIARWQKESSEINILGSSDIIDAKTTNDTGRLYSQLGQFMLGQK